MEATISWAASLSTQRVHVAIHFRLRVFGVLGVNGSRGLRARACRVQGLV